MVKTCGTCKYFVGEKYEARCEIRLPVGYHRTTPGQTLSGSAGCSLHKVLEEDIKVGMSS